MWKTGVQTDSVDTNGYGHSSVNNPLLRCVMMLVRVSSKKRVDPARRDSSGHTPMDLAERDAVRDDMALLLESWVAQIE
ncbi:hypothetical protein N7519_005892 [Penicillium mononematosum]|uniref:uncharacterized protein n=1 Tax=Penicillium mononematosum TaxID=268346 RepID=UPI0025483F1B|nr:uncharacterized protein N7519_005892 [Penicillium mononematosum]KAJ6184591.1 hypothetical protein N7519_005892 [Penicillium mononematosum]